MSKWWIKRLISRRLASPIAWTNVEGSSASQRVYTNSPPDDALIVFFDNGMVRDKILERHCGLKYRAHNIQANYE